MNVTELKPQPGPQEKFLKSAADVAIYGGAAGGGKSYGLLLEPLYDVENAGFRSVLFRRTIPMIRQPGGLLDTSEQIYPLLGAKLNQSLLEWRFPSGAAAKLSGMELPSDRFGWQGAQIALICFDEVQEFDETQFWFLFSRNRSVSGARSRIRATCNPDADSWLRNLLSWWIDESTGLPIAARSGVLRNLQPLRTSFDSKSVETGGAASRNRKKLFGHRWHLHPRRVSGEKNHRFSASRFGLGWRGHGTHRGRRKTDA